MGWAPFVRWAADVDLGNRLALCSATGIHRATFSMGILRSQRSTEREMRVLNDEQARRWQADYHELMHIGAPASTEEKVLRLIHNKAYEVASAIAGGASVLDVGCNIGYGTRLLSGAAREAIGIDVSQKALREAKARGGGGPGGHRHRRPKKSARRGEGPPGGRPCWLRAGRGQGSAISLRQIRYGCGVPAPGAPLFLRGVLRRAQASARSSCSAPFFDPQQGCPTR